MQQPLPLLAPEPGAVQPNLPQPAIPAGIPLTQQTLAPTHYATSASPSLLNPVVTTETPLAKAINAETDRRNRVADGLMALAVGWQSEDEQENAELRQLAVSSFGEEWVSEYERAYDKELVAETKMLSGLFLRQGDPDVAHAGARYCRQFGVTPTHGKLAIWEHAAEKLRAAYADNKQVRDAINAGREAANNELDKQMGKLLAEGYDVPGEVVALLSPEDSNVEQAVTDMRNVLARARRTFNYLLDYYRGGRTPEEWEADAAKLAAEKSKKWGSSEHFYIHNPWESKPTEEEFMKQAYSEMSADMANFRKLDVGMVVDLLRDTDGQLDMRALRAVALAMEQKATKDQSTESIFWRNFGKGLSDWANNLIYLQQKAEEATTTEEARKAAIMMAGMSYFPQESEEGELVKQTPYAISPDAMKVRGALRGVADAQREVSDEALWSSKLLAPLGSIAGENAPGVALGFLTGGMGALASTAATASTFMPGLYVEKLEQNYLNDVQNAELDALLYAVPMGAAEGMFGATIRTVPALSKLADWAAAGVLSSTAVGRAAGWIQSNAYRRFIYGVMGESSGELLWENVMGDTGYYLGTEAAQRFGAELQNVKWSPFSDSWEAVKGEPWQTAAVVAYCATLGMAGAPYNAAAARAFSERKDNLLNAGLTEKTVNRLNLMAKDSTTSDISFLEAAQKAIREEVLNGDPVEVRERFRARNQLLMDDAEALVYARNNVLHNVLVSEGVEVEKTDDGKFVVMQEDSSSKEPGAKKRVEMTPEQFGAYTQVIIEHAREKSMREIHRSMLNGENLGEVLVEKLRTVASSARAKDAAGKAGEANPLLSTFSAYNIDSPIVAETLSASRGQITYPLLVAISKEAAALGEEGPRLIDGVANSVLVNLPASGENRLQQAVESAEITEQQRQEILRGDRAFGAVRLNNEAGGSTILTAGSTTMTGYVEDYFEHGLTEAINAAGGKNTPEGRAYIQSIADRLQHVRDGVLKATGKDIMVGFNPNSRDVGKLTEYFSHFAQSRYYIQNRANPKDATEAAVAKLADAALMNAALHSTMQAAYPVWAETEGGKAFEADGGTLGALLREVGIKVDNLYEQSRVTAENLAETMKERGALYGPSASELNTKAKEEEKARHEAAKPQPVEVSETFDPSIKPEDVQKLIEAERAIFPVVEPVPSSGDELETKLLQRKAGVQDVAVFCRKTPELTYQQAEERGLIARGQDGTPQATWVMGATIAEHAPEALFQSYTSGEKTQLQAYKLASEISTGEFSVQVARESGLMPEGKLDAANGTLYTMGSSSFALLARHASPHSGIRKFLMEFIGSGEGAQAYGHGMYFSTSMGVHRSYVRQFRNRYKELVRPADNIPSEVFYLARAAAHELGAGFSKTQILEHFRKEARERYERENETLEYWEKELEERKQEQGYYRDEDMISVAERKVEIQRMEVAHYKKQYDIAMQGSFEDFFVFNEGVNASEYEVMLNFDRNGENLLRWDEEVPRALASKLGMMTPEEFAATDKGFKTWAKRTAITTNMSSNVERYVEHLEHKRHKPEAAKAVRNKVIFEDTLGVDLYKLLRKVHGSKEAASKALLAAGIRGVEYRDGASRNDGEDITYNYVIFDEADVKVVRVKDHETGYEWQEYTDAGATFNLSPETVASWKRKVDEIAASKDMSTKLVDMMPMPAILRRLGCKQDTLKIKPRTVQKMWEKGIPDPQTGHRHNLTKAQIESLPFELDDPIAVFENQLLSGYDSFTVLTQLRIWNQTVIVAIHVNRTWGRALVDLVASAYEINTPGKLQNMKLLYIDEKRAPKWCRNILKATQQKTSKLRRRTQVPTPDSGLLSSEESEDSILTKEVFVKELNASKSTYSLATGRPLGKVSPRVAYMQNMIKAVEGAGASWQAMFADTEYSSKSPGFGRMAAQQMGSIMGLALKVYHELPRSKRKAMTDKLRRATVYARMVEDGKILTYGQVPSEERARLSDAVADELAEMWADQLGAAGADIEVSEETERGSKGAVARGNLSKAEVQQLWRETAAEAARNVGAAEIGKVYTELAEEAATQMKAMLHEDAMKDIDRILERLTPKKDKKSGKLKRGIADSDTYREVQALGELINKSEKERDDTIQELMAKIDALKQNEDGALTVEENEKREKLEAELDDWTLFGAARHRGWEAAMAARDRLLNRAVLGIEAWRAQEAYRKAQTDALVARTLRAIGSPDEGELAIQKGKSTAINLTGAVKGLELSNTTLMSLAQLFQRMSSLPGIGEFCAETVDMIANANGAALERKADTDAGLRLFLENELGLKTEKQRAEFMAKLQQLEQTNIKPKGEEKRFNERISRAWAGEWLDMSPEAREAYRLEWEGAKNPNPNQKPIPDYALDALHEAYNANLAGKDKDFITVDVTGRVAARKKPLHISRNQALNVLLLCGQERYRANADKHGYTAEILDQLREFCGEDVLKLGIWMRTWLDNTGLKQVYEAREGVPFPAEENYWPGNFDLSSKAGEEKNNAPGMAQGSPIGGGKHNMLKTRVTHNLAFDLNLGATQVFLANVAQTDNYICYGEITRKWRALLSHDAFARGLRQHIGEAEFKALKEGLNMLDMQGIQEALGQQALSKLMARVQSVAAPMLLAFNVGTMAKQITALLHATAAPGFGPFELLAEMLHLRSGKGRMTVEEMVQQPIFRARAATRDTETWQRMMSAGADVKYSGLDALSQYGMDKLEAIDGWANAVSMTALYNLHWKRMEKEAKEAGIALDEDYAHAECMKLVNRTMDQAAQPKLQTQKAMIQACGGAGLFGRMAFYMSSEQLNKSGLIIRNFRREGGWRSPKAYKAAWGFMATLGLPTQAICMILEVARGQGPEDDEFALWFSLNLAYGLSGFGMMNAVPILGDAVNATQEAIFGKKYVQTSPWQTLLGIDFLSRGTRLYNLLTDEKKSKKATVGTYYVALATLMRATSFGAIAGAASGASQGSQFVTSSLSLAQSINAALNLLRIPMEADSNATRTAKKRRKSKDESSVYHYLDPRNHLDDAYGR